jgi:hypothetical protein
VTDPDIAAANAGHQQFVRDQASMQLRFLVEQDLEGLGIVLAETFASVALGPTGATTAATLISLIQKAIEPGASTTTPTTKT